jgi:hypothetical protein
MLSGMKTASGTPTWGKVDSCTSHTPSLPRSNWSDAKGEINYYVFYILTKNDNLLVTHKNPPRKRESFEPNNLSPSSPSNLAHATKTLFKLNP